MLLCLISDINLEVTVVAGTAALKASIFPFIISKHLGRDTLRLCKYPIFPGNFAYLFLHPLVYLA